MATKIIVVAHVIDGDPHFDMQRHRSLREALEAISFDPDIEVIGHPLITSVAPAATVTTDKYFEANGESFSSVNLLELLQGDYTLIRIQDGTGNPWYLIRLLPTGEVRCGFCLGTSGDWTVYTIRKEELLRSVHEWVLDLESGDEENAVQALAEVEYSGDKDVPFSHMTLLLGWNGTDPNPMAIPEEEKSPS